VLVVCIACGCACVGVCVCGCVRVYVCVCAQVGVYVSKHLVLSVRLRAMGVSA